MCCAEFDEPEREWTDLRAGQRGGDVDRWIADAVGHRRGPAAGDQISFEDAIEVADHGAANLGVVVVVRRRVHSPVDATNDRNLGIDHEQLDVVDHLLAHRIVDDIDACGAEQGGGGDAREL